jgi:hypothetical protein
MKQSLGTWGGNTLENDAAIDFLDDFWSSRRRWHSVTKALEALNAEDQPDVDLGGRAIAAAEVVAAAIGTPSGDMKEAILAWAVSHPPPNLQELLSLCGHALSKVQEQGSELNQLWEDSGARGQWLGTLRDLEKRLSSPNTSVLAPELAPKPRKRIRVKVGDIFQISLPNGSFGYGRMHGDLNFFIYQDTSDKPNCPPSGSRQFKFYGFGLDEELRSGTCPIVGVDPFGESEDGSAPPYYTGFPPALKVGYGERRFVVPFGECANLERLGSCGLELLAERIMHGPSTRQRAAEDLGLPPPMDERSGIILSNGSLWGRWKVDTDF